MYFNICNDISIRNHHLKGEKSILIRVLEPSYKIKGIPYEIENIDEYKNVLELYIEDTVTEQKNIDSENIFDYKKAKLLNDFILNNNFDEVVVHCSLGISRSPAIMICIAKLLNNPEIESIVKEKYRFYNRYIVDTFENSNYSIKTVDSIEISGNILYKDNKQDIEHILKKMIK